VMGVGFLDSCCSHYVLIKFPKGFQYYVPNSMPNLTPLLTLLEKPIVTGIVQWHSCITRLHESVCGSVIDSVFRASGVSAKPPPPPPPPLNHDSRNFPITLKIYL
jgi:hypothetical protein